MEREVILMSEHQLVKPVKQFTADYVRHLVSLKNYFFSIPYC